MSYRIAPKVFPRLVQWFFFLSTLWIGWRFFAFCRFAVGAGPEASRPAGVEGFLPISALLGLRHALATGTWDPVHPAGLTIFLAALAMALLFRKSFCGHVCPVGFLFARLGRLGLRLGLARSVSGRVETWLKLPQYLLLAFFLYSVFWGLDQASVEDFLQSAYNLTADARMLAFFLHPGTTLVVVLVVLAATGLVWRGAFCRWLCPYGALLGLLAWIGPTALVHDRTACTDCGLCRRACPVDLPPTAGPRPLACSGCAACVLACPKAGAVTFRFAGHGAPWWLTAAGALGVFLFAWLAASHFGLWDSRLPAAMLKQLYASVLGA